MWTWEWDKKEAFLNVHVRWTRWRRGPVTLYRQEFDLGQARSVHWFLYAVDNFGLGLQLPEFVTKPLDKLLGV